jgi:hypothetical protein
MAVTLGLPCVEMHHILDLAGVHAADSHSTATLIAACWSSELAHGSDQIHTATFQPVHLACCQLAAMHRPSNMPARPQQSAAASILNSLHEFA